MTYLRDTADRARCTWENCRLLASSRLPFSLCDDHILLIVSTAQDWDPENPVQPVRSRETIGSVYYLRCAGRLKVGYASNLRRRFAQYPPGTELLAAHPGTVKDEQVAHSLLAAHRLEGREWYAINDETMRHVETVVKDYGPPPTIAGRREAKRNRQPVHMKDVPRHI